VYIDEGLCLRSEGNVGNKDIASVREQKLRKAKVDACGCFEEEFCSAFLLYIPDPAPVTMADLPATEKAVELAESAMLLCL